MIRPVLGRVAVGALLLLSTTTVVADRAGASAVRTAAPVDATQPLLDPPSEALLEPPFANGGLELQERAGATKGLCATLRGQAELEEPRPDKIEEQLRWATKYYAGLRLFDPSGRVTDPQSGEEERLPGDLAAFVADEKRALFGLQRRLEYARLLVDQGSIPRDQMQSRLDHALVAFARSDYDLAHRALLVAQRKYC